MALPFHVPLGVSLPPFLYLDLHRKEGLLLLKVSSGDRIHQAHLALIRESRSLKIFGDSI
ncbi:hypothetical protein Syun_001680 [Stephania yunnanensis]|uniref:Uncharacterized protein n=1 Tax=Stephania yunnanensis TaxID=152371 RepID=A0AAP0Q6P3_9MAGN